MTREPSREFEKIFCTLANCFRQLQKQMKVVQKQISKLSTEKDTHEKKFELLRAVKRWTHSSWVRFAVFLVQLHIMIKFVIFIQRKGSMYLFLPTKTTNDCKHRNKTVFPTNIFNNNQRLFSNLAKDFAHCWPRVCTTLTRVYTTQQVLACTFLTCTSLANLRSRMYISQIIILRKTLSWIFWIFLCVELPKAKEQLAPKNLMEPTKYFLLEHVHNDDLTCHLHNFDQNCT